STWAPICAASRSCSATPRSPPPSATPTSLPSACCRSTRTRTRAPTRNASRCRRRRLCACVFAASPAKTGTRSTTRGDRLLRAVAPVPGDGELAFEKIEHAGPFGGELLGHERTPGEARQGVQLEEDGPGPRSDHVG